MLKYEQIALDIQKKISNGTYKPNDQLPLEKEMCVTYGVSRITIKKAMDNLVMNGLVVKRRGSGTFVKDVDRKELKEISTSEQFQGFSNTYKGQSVESKIIEFNIINPTKEIATKLKIHEEEFVYSICRVRYVKKTPYVIEYTYMPINLVTGIRRDILESSIYSYIQEELGYKIKSAHRTLRALLPSELEQQYLEIDSKFPILQVEQVAYLDNGQPFEYSKSNHRSDLFEFKSISIKQ